MSTNEAKHTPGPWCTGSTNVPQPLYRGVIAIVEYNPDRFVSVWVDDDERAWRVHEQSEANARLIAAAPDMLEALEAIRFLLNEDRGYYVSASRLNELWEMVNKAIAKAKGEVT